MKKEKYIVTDIKWDTDDDKELFDSLPQKVVLPDSLSKMMDQKDEGVPLDNISNWLSDTYGFCHNGFIIHKESVYCPIWVKYTSINCDGETKKWLQTMDEILKDWWVNDAMNLPNADDAITECSLDGEPLNVDSFDQLVTELNILYWKGQQEDKIC